MSIAPISYKLEFETNMARASFRCKEEILAECSEPTKSITLNAAELTVDRCRVDTGHTVLDAAVDLDAEREEMRITLPEKISGRFTIYVDFAGALNNRLLGFYRSSYKEGGKTKHMATTQFEAADARRAFPCWDRPDAKATFEISIACSPNLKAISNMPEVYRSRSGRKTIYHFAKTPIMSTYLVYLGVGDLEYVSKKAGNVSVRVVTVRGKKGLGKHALELACRLLPAYERYFGIRYPLPKLDLIAVPDFAAGAMENWGAITFRESLLLYHPKRSSTRTKRLIAEVISHEIAHQWFGNLVTMKWWNDLWLNESFATLMATKFVDMLHPEWETWDQFVGETMGAAMQLDGLNSTHPIDVEVSSPSQIREIFDAISYDKGCCVLMMLEDYVGKQIFRRGLKAYLKKFAYANAEGGDLWDAIGAVSALPVKAMMGTWTGRAGFPAVRVRRSRDALLLKQRRFKYERVGKERAARWHIPVSIGREKRKRTHLMTKSTDSAPSSNGFELVNSGRRGFYRVEYSPADLRECKKLVQRRRIPRMDRWAVQSDLFALCLAGEAPPSLYLDFSEAYMNEESYVPATSVAHNLFFTYTTIFREAEKAHAAVRRVSEHFGSLLLRLGWSPRRGESEAWPQLRSFVVTSLGMMGEARVQKRAISLFAGMDRGRRGIPPDLQEAVCSLAAWTDGGAALRRMYRRADSHEEKQRILRAMGNFSDRSALLESLEFGLTDGVRSQDLHMLVASVASNPAEQQIVLPWIESRWSEVAGKVGLGNPLLARIVSSAASTAEPEMEERVRRFFQKNPVPGSERALEQALERVRIRHGFRQALRSDLGDGR